MPQIQFKGKQFIQNYHLGVKFHELISDKSKSRNEAVPSDEKIVGRCRNGALPRSSPISLHDNLIVHGDNLKALKSLLPTYGGKVKCVYIDPPYNTGNEKWVYNDNVNSPMIKEWLGKIVDTEDLTRHEKWLCMMMPRLKLLRELLREDGVIFISIDDNEVHHLRMLMDEIFGEDNFVADFIWKKKGGASNTETVVGIITEHIICYSKKEEGKNFNRRVIERDYDGKDEDGYYNLENITKTNAGAYERKTMIYGIRHPETGEIINPPAGRRWVINEKTKDELLEQDLLYFIKDKNNNWDIKRKKYDSDYDENSAVYLNLFFEKGSLKTAKSELENIGFEREKFDTPKPTILIKHILGMVTNKDSIILDSFAGSGTTAHAVLALNKEDGGNRKFILVECEEYADKITAERVRRVMSGVKNAKDENLKNGYGGSFSYFEIGHPVKLAEILTGKHFPSYKELARYIFFTATGEEFNEKDFDENKNFIGESKDYLVYLFYKPDLEYLRNTALTLSRADALGAYKNKRRLVFAPTKYLDQEYLDRYRIDFAQLPFEIYERAG
ncbi:MAG: site-specific DNA-methyltransferase [bacterium]